MPSIIPSRPPESIHVERAVGGWIVTCFDGSKLLVLDGEEPKWGATSDSTGYVSVEWEGEYLLVRFRLTDD